MKKNNYQQWEYRVEFASADVNRRSLKEIGEAGWEMCGCVPGLPPSDLTSNFPGVVIYYFKRPVRPTK